jgi:hypothetical protein
MIATPVQCDVDRIPKGSHSVSVPAIKVSWDPSCRSSRLRRVSQLLRGASRSPEESCWRTRKQGSIERSTPIHGWPRPQHRDRRVAGVGEQRRQLLHRERMGHPSTRFIRIVFDDEEAARRRHPTFAPADECRLIVNVVQRVGHENAVEVGEWPRVVREVTAMRCDADSIMLVRDPSKDRAVSVHRVNGAAR